MKNELSHREIVDGEKANETKKKNRMNVRTGHSDKADDGTRARSIDEIIKTYIRTENKLYKRQNNFFFLLME